MNLTSVDPPEVIRFVKREYPEVELIKPKASIYQIAVEKTLLPTRRVRWCCNEYKENAGAGKVTVITPKRNLPILQSAVPEAVLLPDRDETYFSEAVITDGEGRTLASFRAWEKTAWRTWTGPMNKDLWHYSITATEEEVLAVFPDLEDGGVDRCPATLDMGDKQVSGTLSGSLQGDFEDGRPAFLFYPAETSGYKDAGIFEPGAPTTRFLAARPGSYRGRYYFAEKGISFLSDGDESQVQAWELVSFLYRLSLTDELPEWVYAPVHDTAIPEGTPFRDYVTLLVRTGILPWGSPDWEFDAYAPVTRAQFAAVLHRLLEAEAR